MMITQPVCLLQIIYPVVMTILDVNDNAPIFQGGPFETTVNEVICREA